MIFVIRWGNMFLTYTILGHFCWIVQRHFYQMVWGSSFQRDTFMNYATWWAFPVWISHITEIMLLTEDTLWYFVWCHYPFVFPRPIIYILICLQLKKHWKRFMVNIVIVCFQLTKHQFMPGITCVTLLMICPLMITVGFKYLDLRVKYLLSLYCLAA